MDHTRLLEIENEAKKRINKWLTNSSIEEMTRYGSMFYFDLSLGLLGGYSFKAKKWMKNDFRGFITLDEFFNPKYNFMINELFQKTLNENPIKYIEDEGNS